MDRKINIHLCFVFILFILISNTSQYGGVTFHLKLVTCNNILLQPESERKVNSYLGFFFTDLHLICFPCFVFISFKLTHEHIIRIEKILKAISLCGHTNITCVLIILFNNEERRDMNIKRHC